MLALAVEFFINAKLAEPVADEPLPSATFWEATDKLLVFNVEVVTVPDDSKSVVLMSPLTVKSPVIAPPDSLRNLGDVES